MTPTFEWPILNPSPDQLSLIVGVLVGLALLFCGRRLYWLFVATIGFIITSVLAHALLPIPEDNAWWLALPILVGIIGAFLSVFLQKFFIRLGGLLTGAYLGYFLSAPLLEEPWPWVVLGASAVLGFFLVMILFNGALILLSSFLGAMLILEPMQSEPEIRLAVVGALVVVGCLVQTRSKPKKQEPKKE